MMGKVFSINTSGKKGVSKKPIAKGRIRKGWGLSGDAHAGRWHRQVSLLPLERIKEQKFCPELKGREKDTLEPGDFAENITTQGLDLACLEIGQQVRIGEKVKLRVTQIGKKCHTYCAVYKKIGKCIMPKEGIFTRVLEGGNIEVGDEIKVIGDDKDWDSHSK